jgi:DNA-binding NarL/FixJ family response regulator
MEPQESFRADTTSDKIKVVILEDNRHHRAGMVHELAAAEEIEVVGASAQPGEILALVKEQRPHVAFIDLKIQDDISVGSKTIQEIKSISPDVKCIVLTAFPELPNFLAAFDAGAEGFIPKDAQPEHQPSLLELIKVVTAGGRYYDPDVVDQMRHYLDDTRLTRAESSTYKEETPLTPREQEVLLELAKGHSNRQIAEELVISPHTVKTHIGSIKTKLGAQDRHQAVLLAMSRGLLGPTQAKTD